MSEKVDLGRPELYINRELSWLAFNDRVLREGLSEDVPLLERLKFLAIVSSNLDEFFMVRVAGLKQQVAAGSRSRDVAGLQAAEQLERIAARTHRMVDEQVDGIGKACDLLAAEGLTIVEPADWDSEQRGFVRSYFMSDVIPVLTPLAVGELDPFPLLPGLTLYLAVVLEAEEGDARISVVSIPRALPRFVTLPGEGGVFVARLEDVVRDNAGRLFRSGRIVGSALFRLTRDADVPVTDDDAEDLLREVEAAVRARRRQGVVRLEVSAAPDERILAWLRQWCQVGDADIYEIDGLLDAKSLFEIVGRPGFNALREPDWPQQPPRDLIGAESIWDAIQDRDILMYHPYETFDPVVQLLEEAADDPNVLAIKQTLYRVSGNSPVIAALARAAESGKQVYVLVELKARFDEAANIQWARRLEDAGCHVIYGIVGLKTHAKLLLIVRREAGGIRRYVHASTGNYNDKTAKLYTDIGFMTANRDFARDASAFFNLLTGYSQSVGWRVFAISPTDSRQRFIEMIDREIEVATPDQPGLILAKMNSLQDKAIIRALYRASRAGVQVRLSIRGICCLRPGVPGVSENIEVTSIVDRYLEHPRIFAFRNGGREEIYLSSADWMVRNLDKRLETVFPILQPDLRRRVFRWLDICFSDNVKAKRLLADGTYVPVERTDPPVRAQQKLHEEAVAAARAADRAPIQFRPLSRPEDGGGGS